MEKIFIENPRYLKKPSSWLTPVTRRTPPKTSFSRMIGARQPPYFQAPVNLHPTLLVRVIVMFLSLYTFPLAKH